MQLARGSCDSWKRVRVIPRTCHEEGPCTVSLADVGVFPNRIGPWVHLQKGQSHMQSTPHLTEGFRPAATSNVMTFDAHNMLPLPLGPSEDAQRKLREADRKAGSLEELPNILHEAAVKRKPEGKHGSMACWEAWGMGAGSR